MRELYLLRKFERRANTIYRNADLLLSDIISHHGRDSEIGVAAGMAVSAADDLISILEHTIRVQKEMRGG